MCLVDTCILNLESFSIIICNVFKFINEKSDFLNKLFLKTVKSQILYLERIFKCHYIKLNNETITTITNNTAISYLFQSCFILYLLN